MNIYVAGASSEVERTAAWIHRLEAEGVRVTYDWTKAVFEHGGNTVSDAKARFFARADLRGIEEASFLWILTPEDTTIGAWVALGYALRDFKGDAGRFIVVSPPASDRTIFTQLQKVVELGSDKEAFEHLLRLG